MSELKFTTTLNYSKKIGHDEIEMNLIELNTGDSMKLGAQIVVPPIVMPDVHENLINYTLQKELYDCFYNQFAINLKYCKEYSLKDIERFATQAAIITIMTIIPNEKSSLVF